MSESPLKLALVISELDIGGAEKNFTHLAVELKLRGHNVHVYSVDPPAKDSSQLAFVQQLNDSEIPVTFLTKARKTPALLAIRSLKHELATFQPDVVQSFLFRANLVSYWATPRKIPLSIGIRQAENRRTVRVIENFLTRRTRQTVFVSKQVAQHYFKPKTSQSIPNATVPISARELEEATQNSSTFWQKRLGTNNSNTISSINSDSRIHVFIGRLTNQKNILQLIRMMDPLLQQYECDQFVIIGTGSLASQAHALANRLPTSPRIHLVGWQPDPIEWLKHSETLLLASKWEGLPNVILEAMSCGTPFLAFPTHGLADIFFPNAADPLSSKEAQDRNRACKLQVTERSVATEFEAKFHQLRLPENRDFLRQWNRNWVIRHFSISSMTDQYEHLFRQLATR